MKEYKRLYVGKLNKSMTSNDLFRLFSNYGKVRYAKIVEDKRFGFVEMENYKDAVDAKEKLNNKSYSGQKLIVLEVNSCASRFDMFIDYFKSKFKDIRSTYPKSNKLSECETDNSQDEDLGEILSEYGHVNHIKILYRDNMYFKNLNF